MTRSRPRERPARFLEVPLLVSGYVAFGLARAAIGRGDPAATDNALLVQRWERALHIAVEPALNQATAANPVAIYLTGYFYRLCLLAVPVILVWLYRAWPARYRHLRTVLVVTTLLDLPLVWLVPESPPRFAQSGVVDYLAGYDILGSGGSRSPRFGVNLLAAMPSMHVAWTTWCGYAVWSVTRRRQSRPAWLTWLAWLLPLTTAYVVLATGHHYVLDIVAGLALVAVAAGLTRLVRWSGWHRGRTTSVVGYAPVPLLTAGSVLHPDAPCPVPAPGLRYNLRGLPPPSSGCHRQRRVGSRGGPTLPTPCTRATATPTPVAAQPSSWSSGGRHWSEPLA